MKIEVIVLAGGKGLRLDSKIKKQFIKINNKEILNYTLEKFDKIESISNIIIVCEEDDINHIENYNISKTIKFAKNGKERMFSVNNGLKLLDEDTDVVIIHDGVRPFFNVDKIGNLVRLAKNGGAIYGVKSTDTIKKVVDNKVKETIDRRLLYNVQTPQAFSRILLIQSYKKALDTNVICTDDSMVIEKFSNAKVEIVESDYENIKITTKIDLEIAKVILGEKNERS